MVKTESSKRLGEYLDIIGSRSTQHLAIRVFSILVVVWVATYAATPSRISSYMIHNTKLSISASTANWYRAMIVTITSISTIILALVMKSGRVYQDDIVFIAILTIYSLYWWQQWWIVHESFTIMGGGIGGGTGVDSSMMSTGLSDEDWDNMAVGRTWTKDLSVPKDRDGRLVAGLNRPEHYDFAPDDMPLYKLEPDLVNMPPSIELDSNDLNRQTRAAGKGVTRRFLPLDGPLPDGRTNWHTENIEHHISTVLDPNSRGHSNRELAGTPSDFAKHGWSKGKESMKDMLASELGTSGLTSKMHDDWLSDYGYTYTGNGGDETCRKSPRTGCGLDGLGRGECRHPHYCSNLSAPTKKHIIKVTQGGSEMLGYP